MLPKLKNYLLVLKSENSDLAIADEAITRETQLTLLHQFSQ
ncbi:MAG: hypothetical protein SAJ37_06405 [Oscillatoria sp. PMC 1068.18]|nr:hypothetical protein [Oscillatoria sp. PMC 1076.18]MEC4988364.1 hypothetical protein [Oscillatoria sp. PMC 1068.18]